MKTTFLSVIRSRAFLIPLTSGLVILIAQSVVAAFSIRPTELQVPVRYTSFGMTNFYTEQWFYQLLFVLFGALVFILHTLIALQLFKKKGRNFAIAFAWFTVVVMVLVFLTTLAIFRVADLT